MQKLIHEGRNVLVLWPVDEWPLGDIRLRLPLAYWRDTFGGQLKCISLNSHKDEDIVWSDVIVIQRESTPGLLRLIRKWRAMQKAVIFDIDDFLLEVPEFLESHTHYKATARLIKQAMAGVNHVTTTTQRLAAELKIFAREVSLIPNRSHHTGGVIQHTSIFGSPIKLLVASTDTVRLDFIVRVLKRIQDAPGCVVQILAIGKTGDFLKANSLLITDIPILNYNEFLNFVSKQENAIGIIPLDDSKFSSCKSPIKYFDYSSCGVPSICSNVPPYLDVISDGLDGLLVSNDEDAWYEAIIKLVNDANQRNEIASKAKSKFELKYSIDRCASDWNSAIEMALFHAKENPVRPESAALNFVKNIFYFIFNRNFYRKVSNYYFKYGFLAISKRFLYMLLKQTKIR